MEIQTKNLLIGVLLLGNYVINYVISHNFKKRVEELSQSGDYSGLARCFDEFMNKELCTDYFLIVRCKIAFMLNDIESFDVLLARISNPVKLSISKMIFAFSLRMNGEKERADKIASTVFDKSDKTDKRYDNTPQTMLLLYEAFKEIDDHENCAEGEKLLEEYEVRVNIERDLVRGVRVFVKCLLNEKQGNNEKNKALLESLVDIPQNPVGKLFERWQV